MYDSIIDYGSVDFYNSGSITAMTAFYTSKDAQLFSKNIINFCLLHTVYSKCRPKLEKVKIWPFFLFLTNLRILFYIFDHRIWKLRQFWYCKSRFLLKNRHRRKIILLLLLATFDHIFQFFWFLIMLLKLFCSFDPRIRKFKRFWYSISRFPLKNRCGVKFILLLLLASLVHQV